MKKIYLGTLALALFANGLFAQSSNAPKETLPLLPSAYAPESNHQVMKASKNTNKDLQVDVWTNDFSDPSTWDIAHDEDVCQLDWEIGVGLTNQGNYPIGPIQSTTASNGYAMLDSEYWYFQYLDETESAWITTATAIDLSTSPDVILEFESYFRNFNQVTCFVVISTNNTDWPSLSYDYDADLNPNVWALFPNVASNQATTNPVTTQINISDVAGGESEVWVRFHWTGQYSNGAVGYSWFVDDARIFEVPENDMNMDYSVISHIGDGNEYGRVPANQLYPDMYFAAATNNAGVQTQTDVTVNVTVENSGGTEVLNVTSDAEATVDAGVSFDWESYEEVDLSADMYTATFTVTSAEEVDGDEFENNVIVRNFEITDNLYSLDAIDVDPVSNISSLGTNSFTGATDGFMMLVYYDLIETSNAVYGAEFLLSSTTVPGGSLFVHLMDTADVFNDVVDDPLYSSDEYYVTQEDVDAGVVQVYFDEVAMLDADAYFVAVEMYSENGDYNIRILDDLTTPQPSGSSMIYIPGDQVYSNGNAAAIRLLTAAGPNAVNEIEKVAVLSQNVPNPASDRTTVSFELLSNQEVTIRLTDVLGKVVLEDKLGNLMPGAHNYTFELGGLQAGTYHYSIVTDNGSLSRSMQIIK
jgi:hypothetical protein